MPRRFALAALSLVLAAACGQPPSPAAVPSPPRLGVESDAPDAHERPAFYSALAGTRAASTSSFRWAGRDGEQGASAQARALAAGKGPVALARAHLSALAGTDGLAATDLSSVEPAEVHDTGRGAVVVRFRQRVEGVEVFRGGASVVMDREGALVARSGELAPSRERPEGASFALDAASAVASALSDVSGEAYAPGDLSAAGAAGAYDTFALRAETSAARAAIFTRPARAKQVWFRLPGALEPAWYVEVGLASLGSHDALDYAYVVSAQDGRLLFRKDLVAHEAFTYRVFASPTAPYTPYDGPQGFAGSPHPTGVPDGSAPAFVPPQDVTIGTTDPWLAAGATSTRGNNADAYADVVAPDGFGSGDVRGTTTEAGKFLHTYDTTKDPALGENRQAAVVHLFYLVNWLHDWYYEAGFDEAAGNAQTSNFNRGGVPGDALLAEAQDNGGLDNANMMTPADGGSPRMQMYLWVPPTPQFARVNTPASAAQITAGGVSNEFGPPSFDLTGDLALVQDASGSKSDGCTALTNGAAVTGKIALVDRGNCSFVVKAKNAQTAGAIGVLIRNVLTTQVLVNMASDDTPAAGTITVPVMLIALDPGKAIGDALAAGAVNVTLKRGTAPYRDGDLDTSIVAHEWGHYISNRLVGNSAGLDTQMAGGLGEGWADFHALLLMVREEDAAIAANPNFSGVYGVGAYATGGESALGGPNDAYYFAIRRVPYSTNLAKNPLTFRHIADGQAIPTETAGGTKIPVAFGASGANNSEVHNTGEIWATMLWECYASLLRDTGRLTFAQAQDRMKRYLVAHYKVVPSSPTLLEARDALLSVALAEDPADFALFFEAFARRGAGIGAVGPNRFSPDNKGVVESYLAGPYLAPGEAAVASVAAGACKDGDLVLDNGETGTVTVVLDNVGTKALAAASATLSSTSSKVSFPGGTSVAVAGTVPFVASGGVTPRTTATFQVAISGAARGDVVPVSLSFPAGYLFGDAPVTVQLRVNHDETANSSTTDDFESSIFAWTPENAATGSQEPWARITQDAGQHTVLGPDVSAVADARLVSPSIVLGATAATVTLRQRYQFEGDATNGYYDGAVVELSQDGGATWSDLGARVKYGTAEAYAGTALVAAGSTNPLAGRRALSGESPGYPNFSTLTLDLGTAYASKTVKLRLRIGSDAFVGASGWEIDDVAVTGATNTPFPAIVDDALVCGSGGAVASAGRPQRTTEGATVTLDASASTAEDPAKPLTFAWTQIGTPAVTISNATSARPTFVAPDVAADTDLTFEVSVSDGTATSTARTVVTVANVNKAPVSQAGAAQTVAAAALVTLDGTGSSDPDPGTTLQYTWAQVSGRTVSLADANTAVATFLAPDVTSSSVLQFSLTVSDGTLSSTSFALVTVNGSGGGGTKSGGGGGCGTAGAAGPLALLAVALLRRRRGNARGERS